MCQIWRKILRQMAPADVNTQTDGEINSQTDASNKDKY
jgi:hypothetical protein